MRRTIQTCVLVVGILTASIYGQSRLQAIELLVRVNPDGSVFTQTGNLSVDLTQPNTDPALLHEFYKSTVAEATCRVTDLQRTADEKRSLALLYPVGTYTRNMYLTSEQYYRTAAALEASVVAMLDGLRRVSDLQQAMELIFQADVYQQSIRQHVQLGYSFSPGKTALDKKVLADLAPANKVPSLEGRVDFIVVLLYQHDWRFIIAIL